MRRIFSGYINIRLWFAYAIDSLVNIFNLLKWEIKEVVFYFKIFFNTSRRCLSINTPFFSLGLFIGILVVFSYEIFQLVEFFFGKSRRNWRSGRFENSMKFGIKILFDFFLNSEIIIFLLKWVETLLQNNILLSSIFKAFYPLL